MQSLGEDVGEIIFDGFATENNSPTVQKQKKYYSDRMGDGFVTLFAILLLHPTIYLLNATVEMAVPDEVPETAFYDLLTVISMPPYELYGAGIILAGSLFMAGQLFNNFMIDSVEKGEILALAHIGVAHLIVGYLFQIGGNYENEISPPGDGPFAVPEGAYLFLENMGYFMPYAGILFFLLIVIFVNRVLVQHKNEVQTTITSGRWKK